ncbi:helix-turn-helix domain-containing protein [Streptomyces populi]
MLAFIEANAGRPITITDIAAAAGATARVVQYTSARHLDTTPLAYLRRVRLEAVHRDLLAADPRATAVTEIATRWGFGHHFSHLYRDAYQTPLSTTPQRSA